MGSGLLHVGPWDYVQDIPMFWFGPSHVAPAGVVERPVTLAGIAPTTPELIGFPFRPRGRHADAQGDRGQLESPPRLVITMVWDAAGVNVLERWEGDWPYLRLIPRWDVVRARDRRTTPTSTAQTHATTGPGSFPDSHRLIAHRFRIGDELHDAGRGARPT